MEKATNQHKLLAFLKDLKTQAIKVMGDAHAIFTGKKERFKGSQVLVKSLKEGEADKTEDAKEFSTSVAKELQWLAPIVARAWDYSLRAEKSNQSACGDIILDNGTVLATKVPVTALLELEKSLQTLKGMIVDNLPVLDLNEGFTADVNRKHVFNAREFSRPRTNKQKVAFVLHPGTDKHAPQVQMIDADVPVATLIHQSWATMIPDITAAETKLRMDELIRAVKKARAVANDTIVPDVEEYGHKLLDYIFGDLLKK